ncbi:MAG TPA: PilN domain-containing protein [Rhodanobacteraceae bacterium]|nr:PilN domain-containing protein [Rhodanobacteraceae bacterium]
MALQDAFQPYIARLRTEYARTPVPGFLAWWGENLRACLPRRWREALRDQSETVLVSDGGDAVTLYLSRQPGEPLARIERGLGEDEQRLAWATAIARIEAPRLRTVLCLPRSRVLLRHLKLPAAAEHNLGQVLGFEMDRQTPFKADQVYADQRVAARDPATHALSVDMAVVPKATLDAELARLEPLHIGLDGVDGWSDEPGGARLGFNLLPTGRRVARRNVRLRINLALGAAALCLLVLAMVQWVDNREQALQAMTEQVAAAQKQARQVVTLRKGLEDSIKAASFLSRKKIAAPSMVVLLRDITHALPDDSYLQRISVDNNDRVSLQGQSDHAASLIKQLSSVPSLADPSLSGTLQPDARTHKDRFNVTATLVSHPKEPPNAPTKAAQ